MRTFGKRVGKYWLSVIRRQYDVYGGSVWGEESAIIDQSGEHKLLWIDGVDKSKQFQAFNTEGDIEKFMIGGGNENRTDG